jgi:hypothetical protein
MKNMGGTTSVAAQRRIAPLSGNGGFALHMEKIRLLKNAQWQIR